MEGGQPDEIISESQTPAHWRRRRAELERWADRDKISRGAKRVALLQGVEVDAELLEALRLLNEAGVGTEFSCAGVSPLDEPEDHSLYAYVTLIDSEAARSFVEYASARMRRRLLVSYEPERRRYDLSSFMLGQNRSFCLLLEACAREFARSAHRQREE